MYVAHSHTISKWAKNKKNGKNSFQIQAETDQ